MGQASPVPAPAGTWRATNRRQLYVRDDEY